MGLVKRALSAIGAMALVVGFASGAYAAAPFSGTIGAICVHGGDTQTITVNAAAGDYVHIVVTIGSSTANGGTQNGTGSANSSGVFKDQWTVAAVSQATTANVTVWVFTPNGVGTLSGSFGIEPIGCEGTEPANLRYSEIDVPQVSNQVEKACATGVSGNAGFDVSIALKVSYNANLNTTITNPSGHMLTLPCNGAAVSLPVLPVTSVVTFHEASLPSGAAAAADTEMTIASEAPVTVIRNVKAAATATPTPTPTTRVLAGTGARPGQPTFPWPGLAILGIVIAGAGASLLIRRRSLIG